MAWLSYLNHKYLQCATHPNASKVNRFYIVNSFIFSIVVFYRNSILLNRKIFVFVKSSVIQPMAAHFGLLINHLLTQVFFQQFRLKIGLSLDLFPTLWFVLPSSFLTHNSSRLLFLQFLYFF